MTDKPNFVLVPYDDKPDAGPRDKPGAGPRDDKPGAPATATAQTGGMLARLRNAATTAANLVAAAAAAIPATLGHAEPPTTSETPPRPRLVFAVDATASREPAWAAARQVTDTLVKVLPGELDVALAVHGGSRVHTFSAFTNDAKTLRDRTAGIACEAGLTRLLPILSTSLKQPALRVVIYIGDVFEESLPHGRQLTDAMGAQGIKLIVLHDTAADPGARRSAETFWDLAKRTGGCVLPFDANAPAKLHDLLSAVAVYAVGGEKLLRERKHQLPGAVALLQHLGRSG